jgi:hypothetical protein
MWQGDRYRFVDSDLGPVTCVRAGLLGAGERGGALALHEARGVVRRLGLESAGGDPRVLVGLAAGLWGGDPARDAAADLAERLAGALEDGSIVIFRGWGLGNEGGGAAAARGAPAARAARFRPRDLSFEGKPYRLIELADLKAMADRDQYERVKPAEARALLARIVAWPGTSRADREELTRVLPLVRDDGGRTSEDTVALLRQAPRGAFAGTTGSSGPAVSPSQLAKAAAPPKEHDLLFEYVSNTGHPISDDEGFELVKPDGAVEKGQLTNGRLERSGVEPGSYELRVFALKGARWSVSEAHPFDEVKLEVAAKGFPDGTKVELAIREAFGPPAGEPLATLAAELAGGAASVTWRYEQPVGGALKEELVFEAAVGKKRALSEVLTISPHPAGTPRGAQERLRLLGYDPGAPADDAAGMKAALEQYQKDNPPLVVSGTLDEFTVNLLEDQIA